MAMKFTACRWAHRFSAATPCGLVEKAASQAAPDVEGIRELARLLREEGAKSGGQNTARSSRWAAVGRGWFSWPVPQPTPKNAITIRPCLMKKRWNLPSPGHPSCGRYGGVGRGRKTRTGRAA